MTRRLLLLLTCLLVGACLQGPAEAEEPPTRVMLVGDSMTHGSTGDYTWRYRLWRHLADTGAAVDLVGPRRDLWDYLGGHDGSFSYADPGFDQDHDALWGQSFTQLTPRIRDEVAASDPDVLVVALGFNDLTWCCSAAHTLEKLRQFLAEAHAASPEVTTVVTTVPTSRLPAAAEYNRLLVEALPSLRAEYPRLVLADTATGFDTARHTFDETHPNANGELHIAAGVADALAGIGLGTPVARPLPTLAVGPAVASRLEVEPGDGEAILSWHSAPGATEHYVWVRDVTLGEDWRRLPLPVGGNGWTAGGLTNGHEHQLRVQAAKVHAVSELMSGVVTVVPRTRVPAPVEVTRVSAGDHRVTTRWRALPGVPTYTVSARRVGSRDVVQRTVTGRARAVVAGLVAGARYRVQVRGVDRGVVGPTSDAVVTRPRGPVIDSPRPRVSASRRGVLRVGWRADPAATRWDVRLRNVTTHTRWRTIDRVSGAQTMLRHRGLRRGDRYAVRLRGWHQRVRGTASPARGVLVPRRR